MYMASHEHQDGVRCGEDRGGLIAARPVKVQNLRGTAEFEACDADFRHSRCIREGKSRGQNDVSDYGFGGREDRDCQLCSVLCSDNFWIMIESRAQLETMMRDLMVTTDGTGLEPMLKTLWLEEYVRAGVQERPEPGNLCRLWKER